MKMAIIPAIAFAGMAMAASAQAQDVKNPNMSMTCGERQQQLIDNLHESIMSSDYKHQLMSQIVGAYERCQNGDKQAWAEVDSYIKDGGSNAKAGTRS